MRRALELRGVVQGVGFRPFLASLATELGLGGGTLNSAEGVRIEVEGSDEAVAEFERRLLTDAPPLSRIVACAAHDVEALGEREFVIGASVADSGVRTLVPPDTALCADCLREFRDPRDRRYRHPFITCTDCGPRLSIITDIPYDRPATTMADFPMCPACAGEYADRSDRRHHAQPIACHDCGPTLTLRGADGAPLVTGERAVEGVQSALRSGRILAIKGLGGYHLACDATNSVAVQRLRDRKRRPDKPFALMVRDLDVAARLLDLTGAAGEVIRAVLTGADAPIVLAPAAHDADVAPDEGPEVAPEVAPGLDELGVMLPYTGLHHLLFADDLTTLVLTSGNLSDEPLAYDDADALARLGGIADLFLTHDRRIHVPVEDSVVAVDEAGVVPIRRSRGHAPLPVPLPPGGHGAPVVLAVGAEIKNTFCLARQDWAFNSAHIGDMGSLESQAAFGRSVDQLLALHASRPTDLVADRHPDYSTRAWAERRADSSGLPLHLVQHHHAHLASLLAEHGRLDEPVIGLTFDGTGYGCDATIWGGEFLLSPGDVTDIRRVGHLSPFALPGGEIAVRRPVRIALALLHCAGLLDRAAGLCPGVEAAEVALVTSQLERGGQPVTTSVGRLWDGLAALIGVRSVVTYEAQAAIELEVLARRALADGIPAHALSLPRRHGSGALDVPALVVDVVRALDAGVDRAALALGLHDALVAASAELAAALAAEHGVEVVGLTGGAFQNRLLTSGLRRALGDLGLTVLTHRVVPANDGGLALGQAAIARAQILRDPTRGGRPCA